MSVRVDNMAGKFELQNLIGTGTFGEAWIAKSKHHGTRCVVKVVKILKLSEKELDQSLTEVSILARMNHPNIVKYLDAYVENGALNIAMEYADGGDLHRKIANQKGIHFGKQTVVDWFVQICLALKYIHSQNILHRDLKSQNIFLTCEDKVKLGDFGIARVLKDSGDHAMTAIGTPFYLSPEICQKKPYNHKSDMWALGCVLYEMCCLHVPFDAEDFQGLVLKILQEKYEPIPSHFGNTLAYLITKLLDKNPDRRPSAEDITSLSVLKSVVHRHEQRPKALKSRSDSNSANIPNPKEEDKKLAKDSGFPRHRKDSVQCITSVDKENINPVTAYKTYLVQNPKFRHLSAVSPKINKIVAKQRRVHSAENETSSSKSKQGRNIEKNDLQPHNPTQARIGSRSKEPGDKNRGEACKLPQSVEENAQKDPPPSTVREERHDSSPKEESEGSGSNQKVGQGQDLMEEQKQSKEHVNKCNEEDKCEGIAKQTGQKRGHDAGPADIQVQVWRDATDVLEQEEQYAGIPARRSSYDPSFAGFDNRSKADKVRRSSLEPRNEQNKRRRSSLDPELRKNSLHPVSKIPLRRNSMEPRPSPIGSEVNRPIRNWLIVPRRESRESVKLSDRDYSDSDDSVFTEQDMTESETPLTSDELPVKTSHVSKARESEGNEISKKYGRDQQPKLVFGPQKREMERAMRRSSSYDTIISRKKKEFSDDLAGSPIQRAHSTGSIDKSDGKASNRRAGSKTYRVSKVRQSIPEDDSEDLNGVSSMSHYAVILTQILCSALSAERKGVGKGANVIQNFLIEKLGDQRIQQIIKTVSETIDDPSKVQTVIDRLHEKERIYLPLFVNLIQLKPT